MAESHNPYVSRGGLKLQAALDAFELDVTNRVAVDLGCNVGGFTDCLLQRGAKQVYAVDTGYGTLAWKLRQDPRVVVLERTNALHFDPRTLEGFAPVDLAVIDLAWTRQQRAIPAALRWLAPSPHARIVTLIKPHYETDASQLRQRGKRGVLDESAAQQVAQQVAANLPVLGVTVGGLIRSPIRGGKGKGRAGNVEYLACLSVSAEGAKFE